MTDSTHNSDSIPVALHSNILRESTLDENHLVLWLPTEHTGKYQYWERISSIPTEAIIRQQGLCAIPATLIRARQSLKGFFDTLLARFRRTESNSWQIPNWNTAAQCGGRQTGQLFVWAEDTSQPLDEDRIRQCWPHSTRIQSLGPNLFLVQGEAAEPISSDDASERQAAELLATARQSGNRSGEASALSDLGVLALERGDNQQAVARLEEALALEQSLGNHSHQGDILANLALAVLRISQPERAMQHLEQAVAIAHSTGNRFVQKFALERMGTVKAVQGDLPAALKLLNEALALAHFLGDRLHEADLLWHIAIRQAETGNRKQALDFGQAAIRLWEKLGNPQARIYVEHLDKYRSGETALPSQELPGTITPASSPERTGPSLLRMAVSAAKALTRFVGSGLKTVSTDVFHQRLQYCAACSYHTGLRCRVCGCFTNLKARLPHEDCPIGQWPRL